MKTNYIQNILGGKLIATIIISMSCLMITGYWYGYIGESEKGEARNEPVAIEEIAKGRDINSDKKTKEEKGNNKKAEGRDKNPDKKKRESKKKYKSKKKTTKEVDRFIIRNADTPHEYKVEKQKIGKRRRAEREPDLSSSTIYPVVTSAVKPGEKVKYIITLENKGNISASDFDVFVDIDSSFSEVKNVTFSGCGKRKKNMDVEGALGISNITVKKDKACEIRFKVTPEVDGNFINTLYISVAAEGGEEIGPIDAVAVTVRGEEIPTIEDTSEELTEDITSPIGKQIEDRNETTPISEGELSSAEPSSAKATEVPATEVHNEKSIETVENPIETVSKESESQPESQPEEVQETSKEPEITEEEIAEAQENNNPEI